MPVPGKSANDTECLPVSPSQIHDAGISVASTTAGISQDTGERSSGSTGFCEQQCKRQLWQIGATTKQLKQ